jgi:hypothetical protein
MLKGKERPIGGMNEARRAASAAKGAHGVETSGRDARIAPETKVVVRRKIDERHRFCRRDNREVLECSHPCGVSQAFVRLGKGEPKGLRGRR